MEERMRNMEEFARYTADMLAMIDEDQRRIAESIRQVIESVQQITESMQQMDAAAERRAELLQRVVQAVTVIQADIVRIDETHT